MTLWDILTLLEWPNTSSCSKFLTMPAFHFVHQTVHCSWYIHLDGTLGECFLRFHLACTYFDLLFYFCAKLMYYTKLSLTYGFYAVCRAAAVVPIYPRLSPHSSPKLFSVYSSKILQPLGWDWNEGFLMDFSK